MVLSVILKENKNEFTATLQHRNTKEVVYEI